MIKCQLAICLVTVLTLETTSLLKNRGKIAYYQDLSRTSFIAGALCTSEVNKIMGEEEPKPLTYIPEVILKKRKNNEEWAIRRKKQLEVRVKKLKSDNFVIKKPEQFIREYRDKELDLVQMKCRTKLQRKALVIPESKLLFVIRIAGKNYMHPKTKKKLYSLRLRRIFSGVFVKASAGKMSILQKVEPYVTHGSS